MGRQRELATADGIPWKLPVDVEHFRGYCAEKWLLAGRKTYQEMEGWFKNHNPIMLSRSAELQDVPVVGSVEEAVELCREAGGEELVVIGGAKTYEVAMPSATHLVLTLVDASFGDAVAFFPEWDATEWVLDHLVRHPADFDHEFAFEFRFLRRIF